MPSLNSFIAQTAKDYDMEYDEVKDIYNRFPETFYDELESRIIPDEIKNMRFSDDPVIIERQKS